MSNPSTEQARALVAGLLLSGIDEVVLAPGSRNGPLSIALAQADAAGRLRLHVRVDERSAAFLGLGIAKRNAAPTAVVCTSGTAAAHFHAAAYEATEAGVPLILLTADRPPMMRGKGANQAVDQRDMFGAAVLRSFDAALAGGQPAAHWHGLVADAVAVAHGNASTAPGAVHVNLPFTEPLVPHDGAADWTDSLPSAAAPRHSGEVQRASWSRLWPSGGSTPRGVVITSDPAQAADVVAFAQALGWPVLGEPGSGARTGPNAIQRGADVVADAGLAPDVVVTVGRFALSRSIAAFVRAAPRHVVVGRSASDPLGTASIQIPRLPDTARVQPTDGEWLRAWCEADARAAEQEVSRVEQALAAVLDRVQAGDLLWYGPSSTIRYAERVAPLFDDVVTSFMNRGANGIDGVTSSAIGAALAHQRRKHDAHAFAVMGDLTFLHDINGLLIPEDSHVPRLTVIVLDSNGGRIFATLEQGAPELAPVFDRVYGTPHNRDLVAIARAYGAHGEAVEDEHGLEPALAAARLRDGISVLVLNVRR